MKFARLLYILKKTAICSWQHYLPEEVLVNYKPEVIKFAVEEHLNKKSRKQEKKNLKNKITKFKVNDLVLIKSHIKSSKQKNITSKLTDIYIGPYQINKILGDSTYELTDKKRKKVIGIFNTKLIKKYFKPEQG